MVRPSNPKLMAKVLEAVTNLGESKGSLTRDVLKFVKQNSAGSQRNLTMQVQRALKHAVNAGLLGCKSGRYKIRLELNKVVPRHRREDAADYESADAPNEMRDESPVGGIDLTRKVQDRQRRMKRSGRGGSKRSRARGRRKKASRRRGGTMVKRSQRITKRSRRGPSNADERNENWTSRKRRMMAKPRMNDDEYENDDNEEDDDEEREEERIREPRRMPKMKSVNEDRYSDISGDSVAVGRHRSRRSKHLAQERRSPSRRGNGDGESHRKPRRSRSRRRRSQPRQRENRQVPAAEEPSEDQGREMNEERDNELMEMDDDQANVERAVTPPDNQRNE